MKRTFTIITFIFLFVLTSRSQNTYVTSGAEMIFSFANIEDNGRMESSTIRWAPVFNLQTMLNADLSSHIGLFSGVAVRNVGYIYNNYSDPATDAVYKKKFRSYNLAVPFGVKFGDLNKLFFYGGYELELPFLYKEKTFDSGDKINKITGFFSHRQELFQHGFLVGVQFPYGFNLKFKYYLSEFHNRNYTDGSGNKPYAGLKSHIFYFSFNSYLFKNFDFYPTTSKKTNMIGKL